jgi:hypothetical protein
MISFNLEKNPKQVRIPDIHKVKNGQRLFFIDGLSQVSITKKITSIGQGSEFLHKNYSYAIFFQRITFQNKSLSKFRKNKLWDGTHSIFKIIEGLICH